MRAGLLGSKVAVGKGCRGGSVRGGSAVGSASGNGLALGAGAMRLTKAASAGSVGAAGLCPTLVGVKVASVMAGLST